MVSRIKGVTWWRNEVVKVAVSRKEDAFMDIWNTIAGKEVEGGRCMCERK